MRNFKLFKVLMKNKIDGRTYEANINAINEKAAERHALHLAQSNWELAKSEVVKGVQ